jgi:hypothetical protein
MQRQSMPSFLRLRKNETWAKTRLGASLIRGRSDSWGSLRAGDSAAQLNSALGRVGSAEKYIDLDLVDRAMGSLVSPAREKFKNLTMRVRSADPFVSGTSTGWRSASENDGRRGPVGRFMS